MMAFFPRNFMLQTPNENEHQHFHVQGLSPILGKRSMSYSEEANDGGGEEENLSDDGSKKRRLNIEQVKILERNFEMGNKLDLERKMQISKALGLQPRQVAIWFQNRRARWKTKQLEKDYDILRNQFDSLKAYNQSLLAHNQKLQAEISTLKGRETTELLNLNKEIDQGSCSNKSENSNEIKLSISTRTQIMNDSPLSTHQHYQHSTINRTFFPPSSSSSMINKPDIDQQIVQNPQTGRFDQPIKEENFTHMFCVMDDQPGFWPYIEQQHFN